MSAELVWGVKASLLAYVGSLADGSIVASGAASRGPSGEFRFPYLESRDAAEHRFGGRVQLVGHGGVMSIAFADPTVTIAEASGELSVTTSEGARATIALMALSHEPGGSWVGTSVRLTADGADLLGALQYYESQPVDDLSFSLPEPTPVFSAAPAAPGAYR